MRLLAQRNIVEKLIAQSAPQRCEALYPLAHCKQMESGEHRHPGCVLVDELLFQRLVLCKTFILIYNGTRFCYTLHHLRIRIVNGTDPCFLFIAEEGINEVIRAEANSQYQVDTVKAELEKLGYTCEYYAFSDSNDLATIATNAANSCDVIYIPTDNTAAANTEIINNICQPAGVPIIAGEEGICSGCGVATLSISYYDLGVATGKMAVKVLTGEADISEMPIEYAPQFTKKYNKTICEALGITVPDDYIAIEE